MESCLDLAEHAVEQRWQVAKQLVVMIWEVSDSDVNDKIRFIQPAERFYR